MGAGHSHSHGLGHSHETAAGSGGGGISDLWTRGRAQLVWILAVVLGLVTVVGVVALWPRQGRLDEVHERASQFGLGTERLSADVTSVADTDCSYATPDNLQRCRVVEFSPKEGPGEGEVRLLGEYNLADPFVLDVSPGDAIVVSYEPLTDTYLYADRERRPALVWLAALFVLVVVAVARWRGALALGALALTVVVLLGFVAPAVLSGRDPLLVCVVGAAAIAFVALYATHGLNTMTTVSLVGTLGALALSLVLGIAFFELADFTGVVSEETSFLPLVAPGIDVKGLLLGGVIIGALGALDDVVVTQAATVRELRAVSPEAPTREIVGSAMRVGRQHTGSIINTLMLAYAGASMPLLLLFSVSGQPLDVVANSELVALEIVRTLVGSIGLLAAVPLTTALAAYLTDPAN